MNSAKSMGRMVGVLLLLANGALATGMSILVHPVLRPSSRALAQWLIVLGATWLALQAVDFTHVMAMLSLSEQYAESAGAPVQLFAILGAVASASRLAAHYSGDSRNGLRRDLLSRVPIALDAREQLEARRCSTVTGFGHRVQTSSCGRPE